MTIKPPLVRDSLLSDRSKECPEMLIELSGREVCVVWLELIAHERKPSRLLTEGTP